MINFEQYLAERSIPGKPSDIQRRIVEDRAELEDMIKNKVSLKDLDVSNVTDMSNLFKQKSDFDIKDIETWDFSGVLIMDSMFWGCDDLISVRLYGLSDVVSMENCFSWCSNLETVELYNTNKVKNLSYTFSHCRKLKKVNMPNMESVYDMYRTFQYCESLKSMYVNSTNLYRIWDCFRGCAKLKNVTFSDTSNLNNGENCFSGCVKLEQVDMPFPKNAKALTRMFYECKMLLQDFSKWNVDGIKHEGMFDKATKMIKSPVNYFPAEYQKK